MTPEEIRRTIGQNIVRLRREYGLSRKSLAKLAGIPLSRLRRVEQEDAHARLYDFHLKRLSEVFHISVENLYEDAADPAQG